VRKNCRRPRPLSGCLPTLNGCLYSGCMYICLHQTAHRWMCTDIRVDGLGCLFSAMSTGVSASFMHLPLKGPFRLPSSHNPGTHTEQTMHLPHAYVNCIESSTPRLVFETILNQLHGHVPNSRCVRVACTRAHAHAFIRTHAHTYAYMHTRTCFLSSEGYFALHHMILTHILLLGVLSAATCSRRTANAVTHHALFNSWLRLYFPAHQPL